MDRFLVIDKEKERIGTHVLVIGVGRYPYLLDGEVRGSLSPDKQFEYHGGMGQLTSPPNSALALANWFATNHRHPKPLRSLQLLISGTPNTFMTPAGQTIAAESATLENIRNAVKVWHDYGNLHEENHLVFYFCGHGVSTGSDQLLLSEDFGSDKHNPFRHAVDFWSFHLGMRACKARCQCYLLDACQTVSQTYRDRFGVKSGDAIVAGSASSNLQKTEQPVLLACALGAKAYGEEGKASFFAQALLAAFKGAAARDNGYGEWEICTAQLRGGLNAFLERMVERGYGKEQVARDEKLTNSFSLHVLDNQPFVPVDISCDDPDKTGELAFDCVLMDGTVKESCPGGKKRIWEIDLPSDKYDFLATNITAGPSPQPRKGVMVYPPYIRVRFKCP